MNITPSLMWRAYLAVFSVCVLYILVFLPTVNGDTDLWYHLSGGRYTVEHGEIADSSFFSFIEPPRQRTNYYWLFQVSTYKIYQYLGYGGLIGLRAVLFVFIAAILWGLFRVRLSGVTPYFTALFILYIMILLPRCLLGRPHVYSYLFMAAFVYVYEVKPGRAYILPVLALLWVNFHGVEYPVMLLISGAYMFEAYTGRLARKSTFTREELIVIVSSAVCIAVVYLTPHGAALLQVPFTDTRYASLYINELNRPGLMEFFRYQIAAEGVPYITLVNVDAALGAICAIICLRYKKLRLSHALMLIGGVVLLTKGLRFRNEFAILAVPVILNALPLMFGGRGDGVKHTAIFRYIAAAALLPLPFIYVHSVMKDSPVLARDLPHGIVSFLKHTSNQGGTRLMNHPNYGGYLQWELYPRYKIAIDMEVPFLFSDFDFYNVLMAYNDEVVLRKFIARYRPSYISVPLSQGAAFKAIIAKIPEYKIVFFDDAEALYSSEPDAKKCCSIKAIDPFAVEVPTKDNATIALLELIRLSAIDPSIDTVNQLIAQIKINEGKFDEAAQYADRLIETSPGLPGGYFLKGDSLLGKRNYAGAVKYFTMSLNRTPDEKKSPIYRKLWVCWFKMNKDKEAYKALSKAVDVFSAQTPYSDLYMLGLLALEEGDRKRAKTLFLFAYEKLPLDDNGTALSTDPTNMDNSTLLEKSLSPAELEPKIKKMLSTL
ncbi:MAG: hypothetical protein HQL01_06745 [Nitrospirae bacterium]|nr:hypothetical protein [Nitrospirota bacterium]